MCERLTTAMVNMLPILVVRRVLHGWPDVVHADRRRS